MRLALALLMGSTLIGGTVLSRPVGAEVPLMAGQTARPLNGRFNAVPVLHSNQPEEVTGPGILVNTAPGSAIAAETGQPIENATYTFNGDFGLHVHHKYYPEDRSKLGGRRRRGLLTIATIVSNPSARPLTLVFERGAVRNSFEAPYLPNNLMGVKPLGPRPWNTGPGDATAVQMLRGKLDRRLSERFVVPPMGQRVLLRKVLPARGIVNALLRGRSDGPFHMAVVAAEQRSPDEALFAMLRSRRLAPGRIYLSRLAEIRSGRIFSRVAGVALGDRYTASLGHDLGQGPLHVPLTSTRRHHFGTRDIQVNRLASRMIDSAVDNVGTYGVRFDVDLALQGSGAHQLVLSHPNVPERGTFTAFRGSLGIRTDEGYREVHVGMRSGESLALAPITLRPGTTQKVRVSLVYPADATPGHLLSVVPDQQLASLRQRQSPELARRDQPAPDAPAPDPQPAPAAAPAPAPADPQPAPAARRTPAAPAPAPPAPPAAPAAPAATAAPAPPEPPVRPATAAAAPLPPIPAPRPAVAPPSQGSLMLQRRYREAIEAQRYWLQRLRDR